MENQIQDNISSSEETISEDDDSSTDGSISEDEKFIKIEEEKDIVGENIIEQETRVPKQEIQSYSVIGEEVIEVVTSQNESSLRVQLRKLIVRLNLKMRRKSLFYVREGDKVAEGDDIVSRMKKPNCTMKWQY